MTSDLENPVGEIALAVELWRDISWVARSGAPVLVTGESRTGTKWVARAIHIRSSRARRPFVTVDCASPDARLEAELFGDPHGGSASDRGSAAKLALADSGTVFLDRIGNLSAGMQQRLFRFLQTRELEAGGSHRRARCVDVRVLAASSPELQEMVARGTFDDALYYRLNVIHLRVPPLRERRGDIGGVVEQLLARRDLHVPGRVARCDR